VNDWIERLTDEELDALYVLVLAGSSEDELNEMLKLASCIAVG
jgi:hypothetical protein